MMFIVVYIFKLLNSISIHCNLQCINYIKISNKIGENIHAAFR